MSTKFRIAILGIGGVGGFFGGKLASRYAKSDDVEIVFIARGENAKVIAENGLTVATGESETISKPSIVTDDPDLIGEVDLLVLATKAYDLEESVRRYAKLIGPRTSVLPLLNGVDHAERIRAIFPGTDVWNGCAFIVARLQSPGVVSVNSETRLFQFGAPGILTEKLERVLSILKKAGIDAELSREIDQTVWEKFIFISPLATLTSALDATIGDLLDSDQNRSSLVGLISEVASLARVKAIKVAENIEEITLEKVRRAPRGATSSMATDFKKGGQTEVETLTGFVVREAKKLGVSVPNYERFYGKLTSGSAPSGENNRQTSEAL